MTEQTEFKVGDKIELVGGSWGDEPEDPQPGDVFVVSEVDDDGDAVFLDEGGREWYANPLDTAGYGFNVVKEGQTLAEKRAEDFKILDEASEKWRSPEHYKFPGGVQVIDITRHLSFPLGNVVKYVSRAGKKGPKLEDLEKAKKYLEWAIEDAKKEGN